MANNSLYDGIIAPQGGLYQPGPPVMLPSSGGLAALGGGMDKVDTSSPLQYGMLQDQFGLTDSGGAGPFSGGKSNANTIDAANPLDVDRLGLTNDPFRKQTSATQAIGDALISNGSSGPTWGPSWDVGINSDLQWQAASPSGPSPTGDSWFGMRSPEENINGVSPRPGMMTGTRSTSMPVRGLAAVQPQVQQAAPQPRPITYSAIPVSAGNFAQGSPNQSFEKQTGMGSVTNQQASSSRWNTGY